MSRRRQRPAVRAMSTAAVRAMSTAAVRAMSTAAVRAMSTAAVRAMSTAAVSAVVATTAARGAQHLPDDARAPWERVNHAGRPVTLLEGPAWVLGAAVGPALAGDARAAPVVVGLAAGAFGALDDLVGSGPSKGLEGHLGALRRGEVTTGAVKIVGLAVTGLLGAALADTTRSRMPLSSARPPRPAERGAAVLAGGAVIAGAANAVNLFDLRPGRALKIVIASGTLLIPRSAPAAAAVGASLGLLGDDLAARSMLGDTGANAAGALLGLALVERTGLLGRCLALAGLTALTLASERVSFSAVIADYPLLRRVDEWGREA